MKLTVGQRLNASWVEGDDDVLHDSPTDLWVLQEPRHPCLTHPMDFNRELVDGMPMSMGVFRVNYACKGSDWVALRICDTGDLELEVIEVVAVAGCSEQPKEWVLRRSK